MEEVLADVSEHAGEGGSQHLLHTVRPTRVLAVLLDIVDVDDRWVAEVNRIVCVGVAKV